MIRHMNIRNILIFFIKFSSCPKLILITRRTILGNVVVLSEIAPMAPALENDYLTFFHIVFYNFIIILIKLYFIFL